jgi:transposase
VRFNERMVAERGAIVRLVQERVLRETEAAAELGLSTRQVRRLVRRVEAADGELNALRYQRSHRAPNRLSDELREQVRAIVHAYPRRNAAAIWEAVEAAGLEPLPSARTVRRWIEAWRVQRQEAPREQPARRFEAPRPLCLVQMDTTSGRRLRGGRTAHVIVILDDGSVKAQDAER